MRYYTYIYLNPLKPGNYTYIKDDYSVSFLFEPFYVGKGCGEQCYSHLKETTKYTCNMFKYNVIQKIKRNNIEPIIFKIIDLIDENSSFEFEMLLIKIIGRRDIKTGPLTNLTNGGDGLTGYIFTDIHKQKLKEKATGRKLSEETKHKKSIALIGRKLSEETKNKMGVSRSGNKNPQWKGGKVKDFWNNIRIHSPLHPFCDSQGYVLEHRLIMEKKLGRYLEKKEIVSHINKIKDDNRIENLLFFSNMKDYRKYLKESRL